MIEIKNLTVAFQENIIFNQFNATIPKGITVISGASGCGKTTLLRTIAGLQTYTGEINGTQDCSLSFSFQDFRLFNNLTVKKNIKIVANPKINIDSLLSQMFIEDFKNKYPQELSGGMKQRVSIARALAKDADIIFFDEPFNALDDYLRTHIIQNMKPYIHDKVTIIVTHNPIDIQQIRPNHFIKL